MELHTIAHGLLSRFKTSTARAMQRSRAHTVRNSFSLHSRPIPVSSHRNSSLQINVAYPRRQCGSGAHELSSSRHRLSSASSLRLPIVRSRASSRFVVRGAKESKDKDWKGKDNGRKGGGGGDGGGSKRDPSKRTGPRPNVWSKDIAETEYQVSKSEAKPQSSKQQGREATASRDGKGGRGCSSTGGIGNVPESGAPRLQTDFDDDYTGVVATGGIPVETQQVLQSPEQMPNPLWPTFLSNNAGVWRGVGAAFSPITAQMEPVALGSSKEYLYDAAVRCSVETIPGLEDSEINGTSLFRNVMWKVGNDQGELGFEQFDDSELFEEDLQGDGNFFMKGINPIELESSAIAEGMVYPPVITGEEFGTAEETKEFLQGPEPIANALYNPEKENQKYGVLRETDPGWESMFKAGTVDAGLLEELKSVIETIKIEDNVPIPVGESAPGNGDVWEDVMEEDTMTLEPGLVFFSDGSYSRGPLSLVPDDLPINDFVSPTFKIEQCLVTGTHRRLRLIHTIAIMESGEEIQVLRVTVYEEQWMGPLNMESISESGGAFLLPFSQRDRISPNELTGSWKTFEMSATAIHQPGATPLTRPAFVHFTQEFMLKHGLPEPLTEYFEEEDEEGEPITEDPSVLWLPGGITASVQAKEEGILTVAIGWFYNKGTFVTMERDYGPDGKLSEVRSQTKVKGGWAGGRM
ncbi:hypothetical protein KC19_VG188200 [Ceratodon purpureus]|uniref:Uncharacterized protein n=1 Tax=Ceratodon purpureus TaxID=3225 RepID=A0A8T0HRY7_CERPU|nr:hypothetical protein KC19_VG188200 [Ceratodon purpureus]